MRGRQNKRTSITKRSILTKRKFEERLQIMRNNAKVKVHVTNADKQAVVYKLLTTYPDWSNRAIARDCGVSDKMVAKYRKLMSEWVENTR